MDGGNYFILMLTGEDQVIRLLFDMTPEIMDFSGEFREDLPTEDYHIQRWQDYNGGLCDRTLMVSHPMSVIRRGPVILARSKRVGCSEMDMFSGETVFGRERMAGGLTENISQKYIALCDREHALLVANDGTYGSSFDETASSLKLTLLRSPSYTAHPVGDRPVMPTDRYMPYIDQCEHDFAFLLEAGERKHVMANAARLAQHFGTRPMLLSLYPSGEGECAACPVTLDESAPVTLQAFKKADDGKGYVVRLFNPTERPQKSKLAVLGKTQLLLFGAFEVKTCYFGELGYMELDPMEWGVAKFR